MTRPTEDSDQPGGAGGADELLGHEVLVAVCGGIAAYKVAYLVSRLVQRGAGVTVAMTAAGRRFVTPLTFSSLSGRRVYTDLWDSADSHDPQHLSLTEAADILIIAPATANIIAKMAHGIADDLVSTMIMAATGPVLVAPAMNTRMWDNAILQSNLRVLADQGRHIAPPGEGWLACRTVGKGRMAEPDEIILQAEAILKQTPPKRAK